MFNRKIDRQAAEPLTPPAPPSLRDVALSMAPAALKAELASILAARDDIKMHDLDEIHSRAVAGKVARRKAGRDEI